METGGLNWWLIEIGKSFLEIYFLIHLEIYYYMYMYILDVEYKYEIE